MEKKRKFIHHYILFGLISTAACELTLIKEQNAVHCVDTSQNSSALAWILPPSSNYVDILTKQNTKWTSSNKKKSALDSFQCDVMNNNCNNIEGKYLYNTQIETPSWNFGPVLDHRWNQFPMKRSNDYVEVPQGDKVAFHVSILATDDVYLFLSEGKDTKLFKTYWFILDEWMMHNELRSVIRKCVFGVPSNRNIGQYTKCAKAQSTYKEPVLHSGERWAHLTIELEKYTPAFRSSRVNIKLKSGQKVLLEWTDDDRPINVNYLTVKTKSNPLVWKYHQYLVLESTFTELQLPKTEIKFTEGKELCLSLIYFTDREINVEKTYRKTKVSGYSSLNIQTLSKGNTWQVAKIKTRLYNNNFYQLIIPLSRGQEFILGDVRLCNKTETYVSTVTGSIDANVKCEALMTSQRVEYQEKKDKSSNFFCSDGSFGQNCSISCQGTLNTRCQGGSVCIPRKCDSVSCSTCFCMPGYRGNNCDIEFPILGSEQYEVRALAGGFEIDIKASPDKFKNITNVLVQYKNINDSIWKNNTNLHSWPVKRKLNVTNLEVNTEYAIRVILIDNTGDGNFEHVPETLVKTSCTTVGSKEIHIDNNSATLNINWENNYKNSCPISDYKVLLNNTEYNFTALPFEIRDFNINDECNITIHAKDLNVYETSLLSLAIYNGQQAKRNGDKEGKITAAIVIPIILLIMVGGAIIGYFFWRMKRNEQITWNQRMNMLNQFANVENFGNTNTGSIALPERRERSETIYERFNRYIPSSVRRLMYVPRQPPPPIPLNITRNYPTTNPPEYLPSRNSPQLPERNTTRNLNSLLPYNQALQRASSPVFSPRPQSIPRHSTLPSTLNTLSHNFIDTDRPPIAPRPISSFFISEKRSLTIRIDDLENYVEESLSSGELQSQHRLFQRGQLQPWDYGQLPENKIKNRYGNLLAYDATRVRLALLPGVPYSDYINANYIDGYKSSQFYIATQGPKQNTLNDFWRMIWQEKVNNIIMLANVVENGKIKCDKYWPDIAQKQTFGNISVQNLSEDIYADFTYRKFNVKYEGQIRKMTHLHFTSWPDHGVPRYPQTLAAFAKKVLTLRNTGPLIVHCSAGVGRTGTIILVDICLRMAAQEKQVDPLGFLQKIRYQRANLVDNAEQYELVHLVLLDCLLTDTFSFPCAKFKAELNQLLANNNKRLSERFARTNQLSTRDSLRIIKRNDINDWPKGKNRFQGIVPSNYGRVILNRPMGGSEYINAVYVDGFRTKEQFIATQLPLPNTVVDLWHLVAQIKTTLIIVLNQPDPMDESTCVFWPEGTGKLQLADLSSIVLQNQSENKMCRKLFLKRYGQDKVEGRLVNTEQNIELLMLKKWRAGMELSLTAEEILDLWQDTQCHYRGKGSIITMCHDGARACGLFLASVFVVEKMKLEKEVDVGLAVRSIRLTRPHFITSINQFAFLHYVARTYLEKYETYANFQ